MEQRENLENAPKWSAEADVRKAVKPFTKNEVEKQIRSGNLTEKQAIELRQRYMDSLEYNQDQQYVTSCGGIKPLPILLPLDEEE